MILQEASPFSPRMTECVRLHKFWGWFVVLGIILMVVGGMAIGAACVATLTTVMVFGILFIAGGVLQIVNAFLVRNWRGFILHLLAGLLELVLGILIFKNPVNMAVGFTLVLAALFTVGGALRIIYALFEDFPGRSWVILNGIVTLILGIMIWQDWPESSLWVIGMFVGIDLLFAGWSWVMLGFMVKSMGRETGTAQPMPQA